MSIYRGVSDCASEPGGSPCRANLPIGICVLASQAEVQHVDLPHRLRSSANWNKVLSLNFPSVNCNNSVPAKFEGLMSLCKNPTSWIASIPFSIWYPSLQCINLHKLFFTPESCFKRKSSFIKDVIYTFQETEQGSEFLRFFEEKNY